MAIGMGTAMLGSALLGVAGNAIGGNSQKKAANAVADMTLTDNRENRAFLQGLQDRNEGYLAPTIATGQAAGVNANALLGFGDQAAVRSAFDTYRNSTGYDFRRQEGIRALQSAFSRSLESGAAAKSALRYGDGLGAQEFSDYYNRIFGQQQLGLQAASALAGVNQNFGAQVVAGNQAATSAAGNARLYAGNANANMWQNMGSSFGSALGAFAPMGPAPMPKVPAQGMYLGQSGTWGW